MGTNKELLDGAGWKPSKSTAGEAPIFDGVYRMQLSEKVDYETEYGKSICGKFVVMETLAGDPIDGRSVFEFFKTDPDKIANKYNGLAKLLNGLFSVGVDADPDNLDAIMGTEVYVRLAKRNKPVKDADGNWTKSEDEYKQTFNFMTEKNAKKEAEKVAKAQAKVPF